MKWLTAFFVMILSLGFLNAQTEEWLWARQSSGNMEGGGNSISSDSSGNHYVTGSFSGTITFGATTLTSSGISDAFVAKINNNGSYLWAVKAGGTNSDIGMGIATDSSGNSYITGSFKGTANFGTYALSASGTNSDIFVAKLDSGGIFQWARKAGGTGADSGSAIGIDSSGNLDIAGYFKGTATFGTMSLTCSTSYFDEFILKLDPSGNWIWVKQAGGTNSDTPESITTDSSGNCYVTGMFRVTATFGSINITSSGNADVFVTKLDANGNFIWAKKAGGTNWDDGYGIATDSSGNCYLAGCFTGTATFGTISLVSTSSAGDCFVSKLDTNGSFVWAIKTSSTASNSAYGFCIAAEASGNSYVSGYFQGSVLFGATTLTSNSSSADIFTSKVDPSGNWLWTKQAGGSENDFPQEICVSGSGNCTSCGSFLGTASFGANSITTGAGSSQVYIARIGNAQNNLVSPNGGEAWQSGTTQTVSWNFNSGTNVNILLSSNNGQNWQQLNAGPVPFIQGSYAFTVPVVSSSQCRMKVISTVNSAWADMTDNTFTIITPAQPPVVSFIADVTMGPEPLTVHFTDLSSPGSGFITSWSWEFGDGGMSSEQHPTHVYLEDGLYSVTLSVTNSDALNASITWDNYICVDNTDPVIWIMPGVLEFGAVCLGESSGIVSVVVGNLGVQDLIITDVYFNANPSPFSVNALNLPIYVPFNSGVSIDCVFTPVAVSEAIGQLIIINNSDNEPTAICGAYGFGFAPPKAPENPNLFIDGDNCMLGWTPVTEDVFGNPTMVSQYRVKIYDSLEPDAGFVSFDIDQPPFIFSINDAPQHRFFSVSALINAPMTAERKLEYPMPALPEKGVRIHP